MRKRGRGGRKGGKSCGMEEREIVFVKNDFKKSKEKKNQQRIFLVCELKVMGKRKAINCHL